MSSFTSEKDRPDEGPTNITQTRGAWIRKMDNGDYEVWYDGKFVVSYGSWSEHIAAAAMQALYDDGFRAGQDDNRKTLRKALGL